ncbi:MAG: hypothetical protein AMXMBFR84_35200 [Candidatus Hydrogenedentota bacterium]
MNTAKDYFVGATSVVSMCLLVSSFVLMYRNFFTESHYSWWLIGGLALQFPVMAKIMAKLFRGSVRPSDEVINHAFDRVYEQRLRSVVFKFPEGWRYKKQGRGVHSFYMQECGHAAVIHVELTYLFETEIDSLEGYLAYATEFVRGLNAELMFNRVADRWGMRIHEFAYKSPRSCGQRLTVPYHGTEYGFFLRTDVADLAQPAGKLFDHFLSHVRFDPPPLKPQLAFGGQLSVALPAEFMPVQTQKTDTATWKSTTRKDCSIWLQYRHECEAPMRPELLRPLLKSCPRPEQGANDFVRGLKKGQIRLSENGFGGYIYYQATDRWGWLAAVGDLPSGGRVLFCLDDKDPEQAPYYGTYFYEQISIEILVTLSERL